MNKQGFGAFGKETKWTAVTEEYGAFADTYASVFAEFSFGNGLSFGVEVHPGTIDTPENTNIQNNGSTGGAVSANGSNTGGSDKTNTASADFEDLTTIYLMWVSEIGLYSRLGYSHVDVATKESLGTGGSYGNVSTDGGTIAFGYQKSNDSGIFVRAELSATRSTLNFPAEISLSTLLSSISNTSLTTSILLSSQVVKLWASCFHTFLRATLFIFSIIFKFNILYQIIWVIIKCLKNLINNAQNVNLKI